MDPLVSSALIGGGARILGGLLGSDAQRDAQRFQAKEAQKNRDFQQQMSDTAIRRRIADLRAGGLNPVLAAGDGASSPAGNMATAVPQTALGDALLDTATTATQVMKTMAEIENIGANTEQTRNLTGITTPASRMGKELGRAGKRVGEFINGGLDTVEDIFQWLGETTGAGVSAIKDQAGFVRKGDFWRDDEGTLNMRIRKGEGRNEYYR